MKEAGEPLGRHGTWLPRNWFWCHQRMNQQPAINCLMNHRALQMVNHYEAAEWQTSVGYQQAEEVWDQFYGGWWVFRFSHGPGTPRLDADDFGWWNYEDSQVSPTLQSRLLWSQPNFMLPSPRPVRLKVHWFKVMVVSQNGGTSKMVGLVND